MEVHLGSDHRGYEARLLIRQYLNELGHQCIDHGCVSTESVDYPQFAQAVGGGVASALDQAIGVLVCGSGVGIAIPANKMPGIRCVVAWCEHVAEFSRRHNHANVLAFGADVQTVTQMKRCIDAYLAAETEGGRHQKRVEMINSLDG